MDGNDVTRRDFATRIAAFAGAGLLAAACRPLAGKGDTASGGLPDPGGETGHETGGGDTADGAWASGGTAAMTGVYPDPFADDTAAACALTCPLTLGPCYAETIERRDISEGYPGLPVRLAFRVVDDTCAPVAGAVVDVWHASTLGLYSGADAATMCTGGDADAEAHRFFRGTQTTDSDGRVDFDTCFPGWYPNRTVHIHFTVRVGADTYVTSQLIFDQALVDAICASHPDYAARGRPDTTNAEDRTVSAAVADVTLETARMDDGALLAWKTLIIRSDLADELCGTPAGPR